MNDYEQKLQDRRDRFAERAEKKRAEADTARQTFDTIHGAIPLGQPILVGHHSEKRHRRDLARANAADQRAREAQQEAARLDHKADSYGTHGISSDDPRADDKIRDKIAELEAKRERIKEHNREARKTGAEKHPSWMLSNLGGNIRRYKQRLADLEKRQDAPEREPVEGDGFRIEYDADDNRVRFLFDKRPDKATCKAMRSAGFVFSRANLAWQRKLTNAGIYAAYKVASDLFGWEDGE